MLDQTTDSEPYRMFATDEPLHEPGNAQPLYGNIPYVTGFTDESASAILWLNSADTYAEIDYELHEGQEGSLISFSSESGALEFFIFANTIETEKRGTNRVKRLNQDLATVSGYAPLPLIQTLGFHFSKWAPVSADALIERSRKFSESGFPLDVIWSDIQWAQQNSVIDGYQYF